MSSIARDVRYAFRTLGRSPMFTFMAAFALALGIGANTAIFSVVNGVVLEGLPYRDSDRIVMLWEDSTPRGGTNRVPVYIFGVQPDLWVPLALAGRENETAATRVGRLMAGSQTERPCPKRKPR